MRTTLASGLILLSAAVVTAQEQDKKLLDRLLKPDMSLQSHVETKQFVAADQVMTKKVPTKPFWVPRSIWQKKFAGVKEVRTEEFGTEQSRFAKQEASVRSRNKLTKLDTPYSTTAYVTRDAHDSRRAVATRDYAGVRTAVVRGKSQKAISAQNRELTIDEVRELLNKNK